MSPDAAKLVGSDDSDEYQTPSEMLTEASASGVVSLESIGRQRLADGDAGVSELGNQL